MQWTTVLHYLHVLRFIRFWQASFTGRIQADFLDSSSHWNMSIQQLNNPAICSSIRSCNVGSICPCRTIHFLLEIPACHFQKNSGYQHQLLLHLCSKLLQLAWSILNVSPHLAGRLPKENSYEWQFYEALLIPKLSESFFPNRGVLFRSEST